MCILSLGGDSLSGTCRRSHCCLHMCILYLCDFGPWKSLEAFLVMIAASREEWWTRIPITRKEAWLTKLK